MISLKEILTIIVFVLLMLSSQIFTPDIAQRAALDPDYDYEGDYVERIYELVDAANAYDSSAIRNYLAEKVMIADYETGKFLVSVLTALAQALNTEIRAQNCEADGNIVSCYVTVMTDLHRAAGHPPAEGIVDVIFRGPEVQQVNENGLIDNSLDKTSWVFRDWLKEHFPPQEANIWGEGGIIDNYIGYINWAIFWIRCQLETENAPPRCPVENF